MVHQSCMRDAQRCERNGYSCLLLQSGLVTLFGKEYPLVSSADMLVNWLVKLLDQLHQSRFPVRLSYTYRIQISNECVSGEQSRHVGVIYIYTANM